MIAITISTRRKPKRRRIAVAENFIAIAPAAAEKVSEPDAKGDKPKPSCSISGNKEGKAPEDETKKDAADRAKKERRNRQQAEVEDRVGPPAGVPDIGRQRGEADDDHRRIDRRRNEAATDQRQAEDRRRQPESRKEKPDKVESRDFLLAQILDEDQRQRDSQAADRHIDPEYPTPMEIGGDEPAERRSHHRTDHRGNREIGERADKIAFRYAAQKDEPPDRHHHRAADALEDAGGDQRAQRVGGSAKHRSDCEDGDRRAKKGGGPKTVGDPAAGRNEYCQRQHIGGQRQFQNDRILMEIERDRRQRG